MNEIKKKEDSSNCDICLRTKIIQGVLAENALVQSCPEREKFGDLTTADHKVLSEGCESRHNHRCAVVVQDLATQWIQSYPCKTKTSNEVPGSDEEAKSHSH